MASSQPADDPTTSKPEEVPTPTSRKRPYPGSKGKARFNKHPKQSTGQLHYQSISLPTSIVIQPIKAFFVIHTGSINLSSFCTLIHQVIVSRDHKMERLLTLPHLRYVSLVAFYYRIVQIGLKYGYSFPTYSINKLKMLAESVLLPDPICKLIECVGLVTLPNGITIVPHVPTNLQMQDHADYVHPYSIVETRIPQPPAGEEANAFFYDGALNVASFIDFNARTTRGFKSNVLFRRVLFDNCEGRVEFSIAREHYEEDTVAKGLHQMEEPLAHLGATYGFRRLENRGNWLGRDDTFLSYVHASTPFHPDLFVVHKVANDLLNNK
jgi:hypothetical protein